MTLTKRLKERTLDYFDWIDFRPDPLCWPMVAVPMALLAGAALVDTVATFLIFLAALAVAMGVAMLFVIACVAWILANALADVTLVEIQKLQQSRTTRAVTGSA